MSGAPTPAESLLSGRLAPIFGPNRTRPLAERRGTWECRLHGDGAPSRFVPRGFETMTALSATAHEHHAEIVAHIQSLLATAESLDRLGPAEIRGTLERELGFLTGQLVPHMEAAERALYPSLERLLQNPHALAPLRREHADVRRLIEDLGGLAVKIGPSWTSKGDLLALRRILYRLFAIVRAHLAEEEHYLTVLAGNLSASETEALASELEHVGRQPL